MNKLQEAYEGITQETKDEFWKLLHKAMLWRGNHGVGWVSPTQCEQYVCHLANWFRDNADLEIMEYT